MKILHFKLFIIIIEIEENQNRGGISFPEQKNSQTILLKSFLVKTVIFKIMT